MCVRSIFFSMLRKFFNFKRDTEDMDIDSELGSSSVEEEGYLPELLDLMDMPTLGSSIATNGKSSTVNKKSKSNVKKSKNKPVVKKKNAPEKKKEQVQVKVERRLVKSENKLNKETERKKKKKMQKTIIKDKLQKNQIRKKTEKIEPMETPKKKNSWWKLNFSIVKPGNRDKQLFWKRKNNKRIKKYKHQVHAEQIEIHDYTDDDPGPSAGYKQNQSHKFLSTQSRGKKELDDIWKIFALDSDDTHNDSIANTCSTSSEEKEAKRMSKPKHPDTLPTIKKTTWMLNRMF